MNGTWRRTCVLGAVALLAAGLLGACGGDDEAAPTPKFSSTPAAPTAETSSPVAASSSAAAESPEAFVRRWNDLSTQMQNAGDTSDFRSVSNGCSACESTADLVDKFYAAGGYVQTEGWKIRSISCESAKENQAECVAQIANDETTYKESSLGAEKTFPAGPFAEYFRVDQANGNWNMAYIAQETR